MKVLQINTVYKKGSTGKIAKGISDLCKGLEIGCKTAYRYCESGSLDDDEIAASTWFDCHAHNRLARYTRLGGCFSYFTTRRFLKKVKAFSPDVIHLHNLHGNFVNLPLLFSYIRKNNVRLIWTLHDCWAFTGQCPHFMFEECDKWKTECQKCPLYAANTSAVRYMHKMKRKWFTGLKNVTIVTPSQWLANLTQESFLNEYPVKVINNGIDLSIFKPTPSDFRKKYKCKDKFLVLGVAFDWGIRKGLDVFIGLAKRLDDNYQIVLVGTNDEIDKQLPDSIISIHKTQNQTELAEIYTAADLFVNPTREDNYPTVNMESIACGTPVLTFRTGGSPEMIGESCGSVVEYNDIDALEKEIKRICTEKPYSVDACLNHAKRFDMYERFEEYIKLYLETKNK